MKKMGFGAEPRRLFPLLEPGCHTGPASQRSCAPAQLRSGHTGPGSDGGVATASRSGAFACGSSWTMPMRSHMQKLRTQKRGPRRRRRSKWAGRWRRRRWRWRWLCWWRRRWRRRLWRLHAAPHGPCPWRAVSRKSSGPKSVAHVVGDAPSGPGGGNVCAHRSLRQSERCVCAPFTRYFSE